MWEALSERRLVVSTANLSEIAAGTAAPTFKGGRIFVQFC
jgi:hypothetical protein